MFENSKKKMLYFIILSLSVNNYMVIHKGHKILTKANYRLVDMDEGIDEN